MILLLILVFIRYYIDRGRLLFCPCSGCQAASLTELGVGYAWENSPLRLVKHCELITEVFNVFTHTTQIYVTIAVLSLSQSLVLRCQLMFISNRSYEYAGVVIVHT